MSGASSDRSIHAAETLIEGLKPQVSQGQASEQVSAVTMTSSVDSSATVAGDSLQAGDIFHGDFLIENAPVKFGGMGEVYKAANIINGAIVAIKLIRHDLSRDPELVKRFKDEDNALRLLNNPAIVRYFGVRREPQLDRLYIVMEYVDGPSLGEYLNRHGALSKGDLERLCQRLVDGLQDAHSKGIIHRDLAPDNILLPGGDIHQAKIIDFGIAKIKSTGELTEFRTSFVGKFAYASPEHFSQTAKVDEKSDIYSLGLILAAAARGRRLVMGIDQLSGAAARLQLPDLADMPAALRPLLARMLDPKPQARPGAAEIASALQSQMASSSGGSRSAMMWAGVGVLLLAAVGLVGARILLNARHGHAQPDRAVEAPAVSLPPPVGAPTSQTQSPVVHFTLHEALDALNLSIKSQPSGCIPLQVAGATTDDIKIWGLVGNAADYDQVKRKAESIGAKLEDRVIASAPACQTLRWMNRLRWTGASTAVNRLVLSVGRTPPVFAGGETVRLSMSLPGPHEYRIFLDDRGGAKVEHSYEQSFVYSSFPVKFSEPGWKIVFLVSAANDISVLDGIGTSSIDGLNDALASLVGSETAAGDTVAAYQLIYRAPANR